MKVVIDIPKDTYIATCNESILPPDVRNVVNAIKNGTPLTPDVLADLLMEERIRGELKQDISYSKDIIDDVRCKLTVDIIDRRPCYCSAELREVRDKR